jgi:hypothetical protein
MKTNDMYHLNIKPGNLLKCREKYKLSDPFISFECLQNAFNRFKGEENEEDKLEMSYAYSAP